MLRSIKPLCVALFISAYMTMGKAEFAFSQMRCVLGRHVSFVRRPLFKQWRLSQSLSEPTLQTACRYPSERPTCATQSWKAQLPLAAPHLQATSSTLRLCPSRRQAKMRPLHSCSSAGPYRGRSRLPRQPQAHCIHMQGKERLVD